MSLSRAALRRQRDEDLGLARSAELEHGLSVGNAAEQVVLDAPTEQRCQRGLAGDRRAGAGHEQAERRPALVLLELERRHDAHARTRRWSEDEAESHDRDEPAHA